MWDEIVMWYEVHKKTLGKTDEIKYSSLCALGWDYDVGWEFWFCGVILLDDVGSDYCMMWCGIIAWCGVRLLHDVGWDYDLGWDFIFTTRNFKHKWLI